MLVVADEVPLRVGGKRRLSRAREPEEDRDAPGLVDVRGAVHREHALEREPVVHDCEDRLLDLARVEGAADDDLDARRVEADERLGARRVLVGIRGDGRRVEDERLRLHVLELVVRRVDEERLREEGMPRRLGDHADGDAVRAVGAGERVDDVDIAFAQPRRDLLAKSLEVILRDLRVDVAPPDAVLRARFADDELVLGRAAGVLTRVHDERAALGEPRVAARERVLVELGRRGVPVDAPSHGDPVLNELVPIRNDRDHSAPSYATLVRT